MAAGRIYSIGENRMRQGRMEGFVYQDGALCCMGENGANRLFLPSIDSTIEDCAWGRLSFQAEITPELAYDVYAFATNSKEADSFLLDEEIQTEQKREWYRKRGALRFINQEDMLLYELEGRYLFLFLETKGRGSGSFKNIQLDLMGDHFMNTFPQVYQERNSFLHRYLSVFSSIYKDFEERIEQADRLVDADTAPLELLQVLSAWLGMDINGSFLEERRLRQLVKEASSLNRKKGTRQVMERLTELILGERAAILERSVIEDYIPPGERRNYERLYGDSPYDVTVLIKSPLPEQHRAWLLFVLEQFKPVRCRLKFIFLEDCKELDSYGYLDINARIFDMKSAAFNGCDRLYGERSLL